jgi:mycothiol system anti-sigma-R factor
MKDTCRAALERAYLFLDGEVLTEHERVEIQVHLEECQPCYESFGLEKEFTLILSRLSRRDQCPEGLKRKIWDRLESE